MYSTTQCVNELLQELSSGAVVQKNKLPDVLTGVLNKHTTNNINLDTELKRLLNHMRRVGLIQREKLSDGNTYIMLSVKGKKRLNSVKLNAITIPQPKKWDGRWRIVSFDIPRELRSRRYELLRELHRLGFAKLLESMWVFPFPCKSEMHQLASSLGLQGNIIYLEATLEKEKEELIKTHFLHLIK